MSCSPAPRTIQCWKSPKKDGAHQSVRAAHYLVATGPAPGVSGGQKELRAARVLVATGRRPVTEGLNLAAVGVKTNDGGGEILGNSRLASSNDRIWAAGDVTGHRAPVFPALPFGPAQLLMALTATHLANTASVTATAAPGQSGGPPHK